LEEESLRDDDGACIEALGESGGGPGGGCGGHVSLLGCAPDGVRGRSRGRLNRPEGPLSGRALRRWRARQTSTERVNDSEAIRVPSTSDCSFATAISGWTRPPRPQSVEATTRSAPTRFARRETRSATSSGCSTTFVEWETIPGMMYLASGSVTSFQIFHSCSWRLWKDVTLPDDKRSEEHTSELQSGENIGCRLLLGQ